MLEDDQGKRRYISGQMPEADDPAESTKPARDDPLLSGLGKFTKAITMDRNVRVLFCKSGAMAHRAGLALKDVTDKAGHQTQRWARTGVAETSARPKAGAPMQHGQVIAFRHGDVQGKGKVVTSGEHGVTVTDESGREHQVRHEHLIGPHGDQPDAENGGTPHPTAPPKAGGDNPPPLFATEFISGLPAKKDQPTKDKDELYKLSGEALDHMKEWLNKGHGVCDQLGYKTMTKGMEGVDWDSPGGMLFIAPLKGEKRASEKVASDYGGDWSQLRDVVRCSIAVDSHDDVKSALDALKRGGINLAQQPKDRFNQPLPVGYRDLLMNIEFPNGAIGEVRLHVKSMLKAKEDGHKHYEAQRTIDSKPRKQWSADDADRWAAANDAQLDIYGRAWQAATGAGEPTGGLEKGFRAMAAKGWDFFEHDGAHFRRPSGPGGVSDVLHGKEWKPYSGDRTKPAVWGDPCGDPLAKSVATGEMQLTKSLVLFLKAD
ncbi:MAG: hypothetical protein GC191_09060 [Azospirillum sp.]|nr:hypothetical protein [Azospirillum sp.]